LAKLDQEGDIYRERKRERERERLEQQVIMTGQNEELQHTLRLNQRFDYLTLLLPPLGHCHIDDITPCRINVFYELHFFFFFYGMEFFRKYA